ncbi:hypothetical protein HY468_05555 [Candidatus Roizmanbacteria bacterium]|nr:hypothetical protein [Candidatus Roizmanbacteria bacterium]
MRKCILSIAVLFSVFLTASIFFSPKADAQIDVQYCQNEYNARRSACIADDNKCSTDCGENQACWDACNKEHNACDEVAVAWQKECLGLNTNDQEMPMEDLQPESVVSKSPPQSPTTQNVQDVQQGKQREDKEEQTNTDCQEAFDNESYFCLREYSACNSSCVDKGRAAANLTVDGGKVTSECLKNVCDPASEACSAKADANFRACQDAGGPGEDSSKESEPFLHLPVFIGEWYDLAVAVSGLPSIIHLMSDDHFFDLSNEARQRKEEREKLKRFRDTVFPLGKELVREEITKVNKLLQELEAEKAASPFIILEGEGAEYKKPAENEFAPLTPNLIPNGGTLQTSGRVLIAGRSYVIELTPYGFEGVPGFLGPKAVVEFDGEHFILKRGVMKIHHERYRGVFEIETVETRIKPFGTAFVVAQNEKDHETYVVVFDGSVEVTGLRSGRTAVVSATGDQQGVLGVGQRISPVKLTMFGVPVLAILGGMFWFMKRRKVITKSSRKKRT